jgi:hypothetical protein
MKILLIHPEDDPERGPWANLRWDSIVDLGLGGRDAYGRWTNKFRCPITTLASMRNGFDDFRQVRHILGLGCGQLIDEHGLDWWEFMSCYLAEEMEALILLQRFARTISSEDEVYVSRHGLHATLLQCLLDTRTKVFPSRSAKKGGLAHYVRASGRLSASQMIDVFWDKYDAGYQLRGRLARKRIPSSRPVVLLPTAYVNVSRTGIAYANTFPDENFLLVSTRQSGRMRCLPPNVAGAWLSSYASVRDRSAENAAMETRWRSLLKGLEGVVEFDTLRRLGYLQRFPRRFRLGVEVRDAWRNVLDTEPIEGVLCADDSNPYTRIPMLLAQARGLANIACHHGALDGGYVYKRSYGDVIWVKGEMEQDYLVRKCGVPPEKIEIGAPALPAASGRRPPNPRAFRADTFRSDIFRSNILFISEAFDISGGRADEFYRDILPPLADLARGTGRRLVVKLHPAESKSERANILARVLSAQQRSVAHIVSGPLTEDLLATAWFGITVLSTVALECAIRGIPCFLCKWLESWPYGYVEQFLRFGVGVGLNYPNEIEKIPEYLQKYPATTGAAENCWQPVDRGRLRELLESSRKEPATVMRSVAEYVPVGKRVEIQQ